MDEIKNKLIEIIKTWTVKPVIFVGSGISKRYKDLPDWWTLLSDIAVHVHPDDKYYLKRKEKQYENQEGRTLQFIAQDLSDEYDELFFNQKIDIELQEEYDKVRNVNPFKFYVAKLINSKDYNECFEQEKEKFQNLSRYVSNVITTNYDTILEDNFVDFTVKIGEVEMLNSRLYNIQELYKIHGCVSKPESIIFTSTDYDELEKKQKYLIAKLLTTFIEYPIIFMGYGINDSDINSILSDIKKCLSAENLEAMSKKMFFINFVPQGKEEIHSRIIQDIPMTQIDINDYTIIYDAITQVKTKYEIGFIRRISESIAKLMYSEIIDEDTVRVTQIDKASDEDLAILIGSKNSILKVGYSTMSVDQIYEDIFSENNNYDATQIIENTLPSLRAKLSMIKNMPLYKFLKTYNKPLPDWLADKKMSTVNDFFTQSRGCNSDKIKYKNRKNYKKIYDIELKHGNDINAIVQDVFVNAENFNVEDLKDFLNKYWNKVNTKTTIKKIVTIYDFKAFK